MKEVNNTEALQTERELTKRAMKTAMEDFEGNEEWVMGVIVLAKGDGETTIHAPSMYLKDYRNIAGAINTAVMDKALGGFHHRTTSEDDDPIA